MAKVVLGMTMSLDGFIQDREGSVARLYSDFAEMHDSEVLQESIKDTGAVVMGRHTFEMGDPDDYAETYEYQVPIFVLTHNPPQKRPRETDHLTFTFVTDGIESAVRQAKAAAGDREVTIVGGASTFQQVLRAGLADELHIDIMPVILGDGLRLFEQLESEQIELEKLLVAETSARIQLKFRVIREH